MSHVSYEWVMSHMNESCLIHIWHSVPYDTCEGVMSELCSVSYEWVTSTTSPTHKRQCTFVHCLLWPTKDNVFCDIDIGSEMSETQRHWVGDVGDVVDTTHSYESHSPTPLQVLPLLGYAVSHVKKVMSHMNESCGIWMSCVNEYGVATISRLLRVIGLSCRISSLL